MPPASTTPAFFNTGKSSGVCSSAAFAARKILRGLFFDFCHQHVHKALRAEHDVVVKPQKERAEHYYEQPDIVIYEVEERRLAERKTPRVSPQDIHGDGGNGKENADQESETGYIRTCKRIRNDKTKFLLSFFML